jgi:ectoine hydroxylase-related dioxygenase (phytanoyl-CoA dioxygenase family)
MLDASCLQYCITDDERRHFQERGYLVVEDALDEDTIRRLTAAVDRIDGAHRARTGMGPHDQTFFADFVGRDPAFTDLVDWPKTFPKVWGLLGWNIYLYHSHLGVNPPVVPEQRGQQKTLGWHQDSGRVNVEMEEHPRPRLSLKVGYFLTDLTTPGRGNFWIIPGSHRQDTLEKPADGVGNPPGAMPVCVRPGTAVFFDRRLWHSASPNTSESSIRKVLFYGYGYRWIRPKDDMTIPDEVMERADPIRRQLLGWATSANGRYSPTDADVPLRTWLREHRPEDAQNVVVAGRD